MSASASVTARRLAAAALAAGALVSVAALPASAADHRPARERVEISAVQADSPGRDDRSNRSLNKEWVELTNTTRQSVNLDGWTLTDDSGHRYTFHDYRLAGCAAVRIHTGVGRDTRTDLYHVAQISSTALELPGCRACTDNAAPLARRLM
ncbi:lamin tail domain-containing protein [Streptomyces sp. NPDC000658]|uniref:lamin tail domain-containing protein n=1 Tax=Streptomyces sp. NPDC000658 TaxID=3154266 RepID=UPI00331DA4C9